MAAIGFQRVRLTALAALLLIACAPAFAKAASDRRSEQADRYLRAQMEALKIPGMQAAVVQGGRIILERSFGTASIELGVPATDETVFSVNSIAKAFTGVAAMWMVEAGKLDLSAPVSKYLDGLPEAWPGRSR